MPTTITATTTLTYTWKEWTRTAIITTSTVTATCIVPPRPQNPAPWWHFKPQIVQSLPTGLAAPNIKRDNAFAIRDALRAERRGRTSEQLKADVIDKRDLVKRSADAPTVTITETTATITSTSTFTAATVTVPTIVTSTTTSTTTLPPTTVYYGEAWSTVTAPQFTRTKLSVTTTWTVSVGTITAALTHWSTVTPTASVSACKSAGGHFGAIWI
ncbi:hypothetical protein BDV97DRAFT_198601 [Delphinella strobiligena]|nr:hypothetical protein BDV97DRAFT_198601 [Delphinella strobiligena]